MTDRLSRTELGVAERLDLRCSVLNLAQGADPIGTAGTYHAYLLVDLPLPWPRDIAEHPLLAEVRGALAGVEGKTRVLGTVPVAPEDPTHRVVTYRRVPGAFLSYARAEAAIGPRVTAADIAAACRELLTAPIVPSDEGDPAPAEVLVCTHGRRDRCCGSLGTNVFTEAVARGVPGVRLARTSHLGGHRFAPTALFLPGGHLWAWLDSDLIAAIASRSVPLRTALPHYRGCSAVGPPAAQVCERAVFAEEGWDWLDARREVRVLPAAEGATTVRVDAVRADGTAVAYEGVVHVVGRRPQPVCGVGEVPDGKSDPIWELTDFRAVEPTTADP